MTRSIAITSLDKKIRFKWVWSNAEDKSTQGQPGIFFDMVVDLRNVTKINVTHLPTAFAVHPREWRRLLRLSPALEVLELHVNTSRPTDPARVIRPQDNAGAYMAYHIIRSHFASLCQELGTPDGQDGMLCPQLCLLTSPHDWILLREIVKVYVPCARTRVAAGASVTLLGHGEDCFPPDGLNLG